MEVDFQELADGALVETIEDPHDASKSLLAIYKDGGVRYAEKLADGDQEQVPVPKTSAIIRHVGFANGAEAYNSVRELLEDILLLVHLTLDLSPEHMLLLGSFVLST